MYELLYSYGRNRPVNVDEFLEFASRKMARDNVIDSVKIKTINQEKSDLWWDMKIGRITASKIYEVTRCTTLNRVRSFENSILGSGSDFSSYAMERGIRLQNRVIDVVSKKLETPLSTCGLLLDPRHPAIGASPDAVGPNFVVEIKCPISQENFKNYLNIRVNKNTGNHLKNKFYSQIQLQMHFSKVQFGYFVIAHSDFESTKEVDILKVDYDEKFTKDLINDAMEFWKAYIFPVMLYNI